MKMYFKPVGSEPFKEIGTLEAAVMTFASGAEMSFGPKEKVFDLKLTDADKELLKGLNIGKR